MLCEISRGDAFICTTPRRLGLRGYSGVSKIRPDLEFIEFEFPDRDATGNKGGRESGLVNLRASDDWDLVDCGVAPNSPLRLNSLCGRRLGVTWTLRRRRLK